MPDNDVYRGNVQIIQMIARALFQRAHARFLASSVLPHLHFAELAFLALE